MSASTEKSWDEFLTDADAEFDNVGVATHTPRDTVADREARELSGIGNNRSVRDASEFDGTRHPCEKCVGTGQVTFGYRYVQTGKCFKCNGRGYFKQSSAARQAAKERREAAKRAKVEANANTAGTFLAERPDINEWLARGIRRGWGFALSMRDALVKYGEWTPKQLAAVEKCVAKDAERRREWAEKDAQPKQVPAFADALLKAFDSALSSGLKRPRLTVLGVKFTRAPDSGKNPGCLYLKAAGDVYLGKLLPDGQFYKSREFTDAHQAVLDQIGEDPLKAAQVHGQQTGSCSCCGRELTNAESIELGIGPICREKWGW